MTLRGTFAMLSPAGLLQALCNEQRSAFVAARSGEARATVWILEGLVVAASCRGLAGAEAVYALAGWRDGDFLVTPVQGAPTQTMCASCEELLLEAARRRDESALGSL